MRLTLVLGCLSKLPKSFGNMPDRYVRKQTAFTEWETPRLPNYQRRRIKWRKQPYFDMFSEWTQQFKDHNAPNEFAPKIYVEPFERFFMFKGDRVEVLVGRDQGKQGVVDRVMSRRNWVTVEGLHCNYKIHQKSPDFQGMCIAQEMPLLYPLQVALVDPSDKKPAQVEWKYDEEGNRVRVSKRSGRVIPIPIEAYETADYKSQELYAAQPKDTDPKELAKITFVPKVATFEMEIMEEMAIKEDRIPYAMFWY